ncbi:MAG: septation protein A [Proteobacteria bacterium]|nr:septation protein A [Pseudomonadota bacterium]
MKLLFDFFPILLFFIAFKMYGIYMATGIAIAASIIQVVVFWLKNRRIENIHLITFAIIVVLGGATLLLHNEMFIKWKPTAINWGLALAFLVSHFIGKKNLVQKMMDKNIDLPETIWKRLNIVWITFFTILGFANLYVVYNYDTNTWVNFKLFGVLGVTVLFVIIQAIYLSRHIQLNEKAH